ncbi:MAG: Elongation factor Ts [Chloroflexi bacterium]|nr:Elongation factor Ts [Chloroflexota bacterium]MBT9166305.1 Elongation factor Ts [Chloroflexota bacterium]
MQVTVEKIKELRQRTGVGIMDCRKALLDCEGDLDIAMARLRGRGFSIAQKKKGRTLRSGLVESYVHGGGRIGVLVEVNCETDFVARTPDFRELAHDLAMQIAACAPEAISPDEVPAGKDSAASDGACLLLQPFIKDPQKTVQDVIFEVIARVGENIRVNRFARFELGG